jgi:predicted deacetylase
MRADNTEQLITAARRRHEFTRSKTIRALRELDDTGTMITFETVARKAQVSRSWLYTQPDIRAEIERLRASGRRTALAPLPARQRSSDPSLQRRLEAINSRNRDLLDENTQLRRRLAETLGLLRAAGIRDPG